MKTGIPLIPDKIDFKPKALLAIKTVTHYLGG